MPYVAVISQFWRKCGHSWYTKRSSLRFSRVGGFTPGLDKLLKLRTCPANLLICQILLLSFSGHIT
jgi:hypothetical protein